MKTLKHYFSDTAIGIICGASSAALGVTWAGAKVRAHFRGKDKPFGRKDLAAACIFVCSVVCGAGSVLLQKEGERLAKPIEDVTNAATQIAHGDFSVRVPLSDNAARVEELKALTENFNTMAAELEGMDYMRRDFMSNVSHELKTPIAAIAGFTELLQSPGLTDAERAEYADLAREQALRLSTLCENMLNMTRLSNQEIVVHNETIRVDEQIRKVAITLLEKWQDRDVEFDLDLPEFSVETDPGLLEQVWTNLLDNAIKYTPDGRAIHVTAELLDACRIDRDNAASNVGGRTTSVFRVCIRDEGEGIAPEKLPKIFDQFYQCEESHKQLGHGLGLSITKRIMELLGGSIDVTSTVGEGSTFIVTL